MSSTCQYHADKVFVCDLPATHLTLRLTRESPSLWSPWPYPPDETVLGTNYVTLSFAPEFCQGHAEIVAKMRNQATRKAQMERHVPRCTVCAEPCLDAAYHMPGVGLLCGDCQRAVHEKPELVHPGKKPRQGGKRAKGLLALVLLLALAPLPALARCPPEHRSATVVRHFRLTHPCPSTHRMSRTCPGYRVDHITSLCSGGPDTVDNLQYQTIAAARLKDRQERAECHALWDEAKPRQGYHRQDRAHRLPDRTLADEGGGSDAK